MWTNLKLFHKGLILISVPLVFELLFVGVLYHLYYQANEEALRQSQSKEFVAETEKLSVTILQSSYAILSYRALRSEAFLNDYDKIVAQIPNIEQQLRLLAQSSPRRQERVKQMKEIVDRILQLMERFRQPSDSVSYLLQNPLSFRMDMEHNYRLFLEQVKRIDLEESQLQMGTAEQVFRDRFRTLLWLGIAANFAITIWLVVLYSKNITQRLGVLGDNARLVAQRQELKTPVFGHDEIAQLDRSLHRMADELKMAEQRKQDFVAMISHDLRSPLTSVQTSLALIQTSGQDLADADKDRLANASRNVGRINRMLEQLLDMEKLEAGMLKVAPALTDLDGILQQSIDSVREQAAEKNVSIKYKSHRLIIRADKERLGQVVTNILSNAVRFAPTGSDIDVTVVDKADTATVSVQDRGPGISKAEQEHVFDRFHQAPAHSTEPRAGTGLGLAIAKALVEAHQGKIGVTSTEGEGSTFWFSIPSA